MASVKTEELIKDSMIEVEKGVETANQTADILNNVHSIFEKADHLVEEVSVSSIEQNDNIEAINVGLSELTDGVSENSVIAKETADAYEQLSNLSTQMSEMMNKFHI